ncbi:hypothetical protein B0T21DRAFT_448986 [Apiosordaria backusii]|uniref:PEBP-like protein n=1 Tax=Apiosordaria backusii TaxID=314023 RepID=A0AA40EN03_9PEZI|nr:hypothetical protein B0T21DRAFT_448986 [Apiosordaria backusii]
MISKYLPLLTLAAIPPILARTPPGFTPSTPNDLIVEYTGFFPQNGVVISREITIPTPRLATTLPLNGTSYSILMIDLDIPTAQPPRQTPCSTGSKPDLGFLLLNTTGEAPVVGYFGPNPPARVPLSHRYVQILVDTSDITEEGEEVLRRAGGMLRGFNAGEVLREAGLEGGVVAGNWYNVTNPGPVVNQTGRASGTASGTATSTGTGSGSTGTGAGDVATAGVGRLRGSVLGAIVGVGVVMFAM